MHFIYRFSVVHYSYNHNPDHYYIMEGAQLTLGQIKHFMLLLLLFYFMYYIYYTCILYYVYIKDVGCIIFSIIKKGYNIM